MNDLPVTHPADDRTPDSTGGTGGPTGAGTDERGDAGPGIGSTGSDARVNVSGSDGLHVIFGTGPVGQWTARSLRDMGFPVRVVNRSGIRPEFLPADVEVVAADASDTTQAIRAAEDAATVYQALNPPYHRWVELFPALQKGALEAAAAAGARYVSIENLYMYGEVDGPMTESLPYNATTKKGRLRAQMAREVAEEHTSGRVRAAVLRSSDYYGPGVVASALGERTFGFVVAGKKAEMLGDADIPHSYAYIEDVGRAAAILGTRDEALGEVWHAPHAPAQTQRHVVEQAFAAAGAPVKVSVLGTLKMRVAGLFIPAAREGVEMMYEFTEPFVVDSGKIERAFGLDATPIDVGVARTVAWYQTRAAGEKGDS